MKKRLITAVLLAAFMLSSTIFVAPDNTSAKTTPGSQYVGSVLFYVVNSDGKDVLISQMPVSDMEKELPAYSQVHNYSLLDRYVTTVHQEAQGFTIWEFLDYAKARSSVSELQGMRYTFADQDSIAFWTLDNKEYGALNTFTYDRLYGQPRYNYPLLYQYWNYDTQDYYDPAGIMTRDEVIDHIVEYGVMEDIVLSINAFSQRYMITSEKWESRDYNMENHWYTSGLLDSARTIRLMLPITEAELRGKVSTAADSRYWCFAIRLDMTGRPNITPLGHVPAPTGYLTEDENYYYVHLDCGDPDASIYYNPFIQNSTYMPSELYDRDDLLAIPKSSVPSGTLEMTAHAVRDGYTDDSVVTLRLSVGDTAPVASAPEGYAAGQGDMLLPLSFNGSTEVMERWAGDLSVAVNGGQLTSESYGVISDEVMGTHTLRISGDVFTAGTTYTITLTSGTFTPQTLYGVTVYKKAPDFSPVTEIFGQSIELLFADEGYHSGASVRVRAAGQTAGVAIPSGYLERAAGRIAVKAEYFTAPDSAMAAPGQYELEVTNTSYYPHTLVVPVTLAEVQYAVISAASAYGAPGDTLTVPVMISNNTGFAGFSFKISYDTDNLTLTGVEKGALLRGDGSDSLFAGSAETAIATWAAAANLTQKDGELLVLTFTVKPGAPTGEHEIALSLYGGLTKNFCDVNGRAVAVKFDNTFEPEPEYILGDVNGDGFLDGKDVTRLLRYTSGLLELSDTQLLAADMNKDGYIDGRDVTRLLRTLAGSV